jgi:hypothetical protein
MVQDPGCIQTCEARHGRSIRHEGRESKSLFHDRPLILGIAGMRISNGKATVSHSGMAHPPGCLVGVRE